MNNIKNYLLCDGFVLQITVNSWHEVALVYDGETVTLYEDGVERLWAVQSGKT